MRPGRLSGAGMAIMASPRHDGDVGDAVHPRTARGPAAGPRIADAARYRRDAQGDLAAQAGGKRGAGRAHQRTPRAPPRRHRIPLPHSTQKGSGIDKAVASECDSVKLRDVRGNERQVLSDRQVTTHSDLTGYSNIRLGIARHNKPAQSRRDSPAIRGESEVVV